uniref:Sin3a_C domain-containing protein n=1 Tax=Globodera pallida TaxID=36090 RepID=A0A183BIV4_GLOPA
MRDFKSFLPDAKLDFSEQQNEQQKPKLEEMREKQSSEHQQQMTVQTQSSNSKPMTTSTSAVASKKQIGKEQSNLNAKVDIFIEVNLAAITALEYARRKIEPLGHEDAKKFMADADLGCSTTFLARAVKKLYGEHGGKILFALKENPLVAVPMVLRRLREKDVECRGLRKEYNEIWRDQVEKNYLKSLDHQALTFKANDVKDIRSKGFILQLENIYDENLRKAIDAGQNEMDGGPQVAIEYPSDQQVFHEANELLLHYIKRQPNIPKKEKGKIKELLHSVVPKLFMLQIALAVGADNEEVETSERSEDESEPTKSDEKAGDDVERQRSTRLRRGRQRRQSLQNEEEAKKNPNSDGAVRVDPETASPSSHYVVRRSDEAHRLDYVLFYGTNPWVLFIRLYAIMCERLAKIKKRTEELVEEYQVELTIREKQKKLYEEKGDSVEAQLMNAVDVHLGLRDLKKPLQNPENFYQIMLQEMKNLLDGQIEASKFEDTLRSMFDTRAYVLFTMDKLVNTLVRQLQNFVGDTTSGQCIDLFNSYFEQRVNGCEHGQDAAHVDQDYSVALEKVLLNQHCFKMYFFNRDHPVVTIELIDTDETDSESNDEEEESANVVALQNWEEYLKEESWDLNDSFSNEKSTRPKLLARNVRYRRILAKFLQNSFGAASVAGQSPNKNYSEEPPTNKKMLHFYVSNGLTQFFDGFEPILLVRKSRNRKAFRKKSIASAKKFHNWLDKFHTDDTELSARWMTTGCTSRPCQHHEFKFLRFNIYSSKDADE